MSLSLIDQYYERLTPAQIREKVRAALQQSSQINQLIDDALMIGKMDHMSDSLTLEDTDLVEFCRAIFEEFEQSVDGSRHTVSFAAYQGGFRYSIDRALLRRAVSNLLANAIKYSPAGGTVRFTLSLENQSLLIRISDQGIGIPVVDQNHVFDGFYRGSNVGKIQGTGLGLAVVKQVVDLHGGSIDLESEQNQGTTFIIKFPA